MIIQTLNVKLLQYYNCVPNIWSFLIDVKIKLCENITFFLSWLPLSVYNLSSHTLCIKQTYTVYIFTQCSISDKLQNVKN